MMPAGFAGLEQQLLVFLLSAIRPGAAFLAAPVFGAPGVPIQLRFVLSVAIGVPAAALSGMTIPVDGLVTVAGVAMILSEVLVGLAIGFAIQIAFSGALLAGEAISNAMGLGFATMANPLTGTSSAAIGQFLSMSCTFLFLAMGGHLVLATIVVESFHAMPPGQAWLTHAAIGEMVRFGSLIFTGGVSIALPVCFAMILIQIVMAMIARAAPTLNLFSVGIPATLVGGFILLAVAIPSMADMMTATIKAGLEQANVFAKGY